MLRLNFVRKEASGKIFEGIFEEEEKVLLKFTDAEAATELFWEHSREFEYKGEMYDIIRHERKGDTTWYWCYWDRKETRVKKDLRDVLANALGNSPQQQKNQKRIGDFFKTLFLHDGPRLRTQEMEGLYVMHAERDALDVLSYAPSPPFPPPK